MTRSELHIAEIPWPSGVTQYRYARYMSECGTKWIRHGLFESYHESGGISSTGHYQDGRETGLWKTFHANGQLASVGSYQQGEEVGQWQFFSEDGTEER